MRKTSSQSHECISFGAPIATNATFNESAVTKVSVAFCIDSMRSFLCTVGVRSEFSAARPSSVASPSHFDSFVIACSMAAGSEFSSNASSAIILLA